MTLEPLFLAILLSFYFFLYLFIYLLILVTFFPPGNHRLITLLNFPGNFLQFFLKIMVTLFLSMLILLLGLLSLNLLLLKFLNTIHKIF